MARLSSGAAPRPHIEAPRGFDAGEPALLQVFSHRVIVRHSREFKDLTILLKILRSSGV